MTSVKTQFRPDYDAALPGELLSWIISERGIKKVDLARRCGRPTKTISEIISGKTTITPETALQLERVLGESAGFWLALEANYQLQQARAKERKASSKAKVAEWAKCFPISEMVRLGFLNENTQESELVETLFRYFGVSSVAAWKDFWQERLNLAHFKQYSHYEIDPFAVAVWLRKGEIISGLMETSRYNEAKFRLALTKIRSLTLEPWSDIEDELMEICKDVGVAVALVPSLKKTGLRGAAYWARKDKAVIILSDHGKNEEQAWFAFFHEAAHILLHSKKSIFIDQDKDGSAEIQIENEANNFSAEMLVPNESIFNILELYSAAEIKKSSDIIIEFAEKIGVSAGLLLKRLQHEGIIEWKTNLNRVLKRRLKFELTE